MSNPGKLDFYLRGTALGCQCCAMQGCEGEGAGEHVCAAPADTRDLVIGVDASQPRKVGANSVDAVQGNTIIAPTQSLKLVTNLADIVQSEGIPHGFAVAVAFDQVTNSEIQSTRSSLSNVLNFPGQSQADERNLSTSNNVQVEDYLHSLAGSPFRQFARLSVALFFSSKYLKPDYTTLKVFENTLKKPALIAVLVSAKKDADDLRLWQAKHSANSYRVIVQGKVCHLGKQRSLLIIAQDKGGSKDTQQPPHAARRSVELGSIRYDMKRWLNKDELDVAPFVWPLHLPLEGYSVVLAERLRELRFPLWQRIFVYLGILSRDNFHIGCGGSRRSSDTNGSREDPGSCGSVGGGNGKLGSGTRNGDVANDQDDMRTVLNQNFGRHVSYVFSLQTFKVQLLWALLVLSVPFLFVSSSKAQVLAQSVIVVLWGWGGYLLPYVAPFVFPENMDYLLEFGLDARQTRIFQRLGSPRTSRIAFYLVAIIGVVLLFLLIFIVNTLFVHLLIYIIYYWGDCINIGCRDASEKHGVWGIAMEVACDIALAIMWEIFYELTKLFVRVLAHMYVFELSVRKNYFKSVFGSFLCASDKALVFIIFATIFVPEWEHPVSPPEGKFADTSRDCSDLWKYRIFGDSDLDCTRRRLPLEFRRNVFARSLKGPFCVAPFISILVKVIVPYLVMRLYYLSKLAERLHWCRWCCAIPRFVVQFFTVIFAFDCDAVGCLKFACSGWPFSNLEVVPLEGQRESDKHAGALLELAMRQAVLKPFEPEEELLEVKLTWLWMLLFVPIRPWGTIGVITTLVASRFQLVSDRVKLLFVRRRVFRPWNGLIRKEQREFSRSSIIACLGFHVMLYCVTYNDDLHRWHLPWYASWMALCALVAWIAVSFLWGLARMDKNRKAISFRGSRDECSVFER